MADDTKQAPNNGTNANGNGMRWHIDRTVNLAVVIGFLGTFMGGVYYAGSASARFEALERREATYASFAERMIRIETQLLGIEASLQDIKLTIRQPQGERR